jgi:hypothetical protein
MLRLLDLLRIECAKCGRSGWDPVQRNWAPKVGANFQLSSGGFGSSIQ